MMAPCVPVGLASFQAIVSRAKQYGIIPFGSVCWRICGKRKLLLLAANHDERSLLLRAGRQLL